jgi:hypothetical protein
MSFCICDTRDNTYLMRQNCAHTRLGFMLEFIMGDWRDALRIESETVAKAVAVAMWPIGAMQPTPYAVEEVESVQPKQFKPFAERIANQAETPELAI